MSEKKVVLVTGSRSGIGRAVAHVLARAGHCVYSSMRLTGGHGGTRADEARAVAAPNSPAPGPRGR